MKNSNANADVDSCSNALANGDAHETEDLDEEELGANCIKVSSVASRLSTLSIFQPARATPVDTAVRKAGNEQCRF
jgi:hypothetical protein